MWEEGGGRWEGSSEPGLAHPSRLLQIVTTAPAISGDFPENGEHGVSDSVSQSWDVIWCQPFCGHRGQHPYLTSPWEGVSTIMACLPGPLPAGGAQFLSSPAPPSPTFQFSSPYPGQLALCLPAATWSEALLHKAFPMHPVQTPPQHPFSPHRLSLAFTAECYYSIVHTGLISPTGQ